MLLYVVARTISIAFSQVFLQMEWWLFDGMDPCCPNSVFMSPPFSFFLNYYSNQQGKGSREDEKEAYVIHGFKMVIYEKARLRRSFRVVCMHSFVK